MLRESLCFVYVCLPQPSSHLAPPHPPRHHRRTGTTHRANLAGRCANAHFTCLDAPANRAARAAASGAAAATAPGAGAIAAAATTPAVPAFEPAHIVESWAACPVKAPTLWDLRVFDASALASRRGGIVSLLETFSRSDPAPLLRRVSAACQRPLLLSITRCAADADRAADPAGALSSLSTTDGCCLESCAAGLRAAVAAGCWDELLSYVCNDTLALPPLPPAGGAAPAAAAGGGASAALSYAELRVAYDVQFLTATFGAGM